jgi:hypothetical protein
VPERGESWEQLRSRLRLGQRLTGTVVSVPRPGAIGIGVDVGLAVGGFVDVLMLPFDSTRWPTVGTEAEFEVWWFDERPQIRLKPVDPGFLRDDFDAWARTMGFPAAANSVVPADPGPNQLEGRSTAS